VRDGDIDYSRYTLIELEEALAGINENLYPRNFENLRFAYEQRSRAMAETVPQDTSTENHAARRESPAAHDWKQFWISRIVAGIGAAACIWWAIDLMTPPGACRPARKLIAQLINAACEHYGPTVAGGIALFLGLITAAYAVLPRETRDA